MGVFGALARGRVDHVTHRGDVGIDRMQVALRAIAHCEGAVFQDECAREGGYIGFSAWVGVTAFVVACHVDKATGVGVGLVVVVGDVDRISLTVDQRCLVAGLVNKDVRDDLALKII